MDLNNDGNPDILSGSYSRMEKSMAGLFHVLWGQPDGTFQAAEVLTGTDGEPLIIPPGDDAKQQGGTSLENICTRPTAVDWDADGDLDLIVGNFGGSFYVFYGEGTGAFQPEAEPLLVDGEMLKIEGHHSDPFIVDWDNDGDLDLLSGSSNGGVQWAENVGSAGQTPELTAFESLIPVHSRVSDSELLRESELVGPTSSTRICVDDVNADGKLDVLVGDSVTLTSPAEGLTIAEYKEKHAEWQSKVEEASTKLSELMQEAQDVQIQETENEAEAEQETDSSGITSWLLSAIGLDGDGDALPELSELEKAQNEFHQLYQQQSEFMTSQRTGFVWLYLQK